MTKDRVVSPTRQEKLNQWGEGLWVDEPNEFELKYKDYICFGRRVCIWEGWKNDHLFGGHWCGYIIIPPDHPWHGKEAFSEKNPYSDLDIHGGITHSGFDHIRPGFSIGFDCGHLGDLTPSMIEIYQKIDKDMPKKFQEAREILRNKSQGWFLNHVYRDIEYVKQECRNLVDQAIEASKKLTNGSAFRSLAEQHLLYR